MGSTDRHVDAYIGKSAHRLDQRSEDCRDTSAPDGYRARVAL
jgi:hypothetical protein